MQRLQGKEPEKREKRDTMGDKKGSRISSLVSSAKPGQQR